MMNYRNLQQAFANTGTVWAVYGLATDLPASHRKYISDRVQRCESSDTSTAETGSVSAPSTQHPKPILMGESEAQPPGLSEPELPILETPSTSWKREDSRTLNVGAKVGIGLTVGTITFALAFWILLDALYLKRRRRERAMMNAVEEVVRAGIQESQERIVLESRVSIVFEGSPASSEDNPRNGMSLPRRE